MIFNCLYSVWFNILTTECDGEPDVPLCTEIVSGLPLLLDPTISERKASAEAQCDYLKDESVFGPCHNIEVRIYFIPM